MLGSCFIMGDSIALGVSLALAHHGVRCDTHARVGAPASVIEHWQARNSYETIIISLGSNNPNPDLPNAIKRLRSNLQARSIIWLLPYNRGVGRVIIGTVSAYWRDDFIDPVRVQSPDAVRPISYQPYVDVLLKY
jgi:hypothetical protein